MRIFLFNSLLLLMNLPVCAQQVVATAGISEKTNGITMEWTLGEPVIETIGNSSNMLTQGLHQTNLLSTGLNELNLPEAGIQVFPNPTNDIISISIIQKKHEVFFIELSDITGQKIIQKEMRSDSEELDLTNYASGIYLLHIWNKNLAHIKTCKIIKH